MSKTEPYGFGTRPVIYAVFETSDLCSSVKKLPSKTKWASFSAADVNIAN